MLGIVPMDIFIFTIICNVAHYFPIFISAPCSPLSLHTAQMSVGVWNTYFTVGVLVVDARYVLGSILWVFCSSSIKQSLLVLYFSIVCALILSAIKLLPIYGDLMD